MDVNENSQGSEQSPSIQDAFTAHMNYEGASQNSTDTATGDTAQAQQAATETQATDQQAGQQQGQGEPQAQGRFDERINELTKSLDEQKRRAEAFELFIASNPEARKAYMQSFGEQQAQGQNGQQQFQQQPGQQQAAPFQLQHNGMSLEQQIEALPEWEPYDPDTVQAHGMVMVQQALQQFLPQVLGPIVQELNQLRQLAPTVQTIAQREQQAQQQQVITKLDSVLFDSVPSAKENDIHFMVANQCLVDEMAKLSPNHSYQDLENATRAAANRAKSLIASMGGGQPQPIQNPMPQTGQRMFSEGGGNMVQPRGAGEPQTAAEAFAAHMNRHRQS